MRLINRVIISAKGHNVSFFDAKERDAKKALKGIRGCSATRKTSFRVAPKPLSPLETPNTPLGGTVRFINRGGAIAPFLRLLFQLLSVGAPTKMDSAGVVLWGTNTCRYTHRDG